MTTYSFVLSSKKLPGMRRWPILLLAEKGHMNQEGYESGEVQIKLKTAIRLRDELNHCIKEADNKKLFWIGEK